MEVLIVIALLGAVTALVATDFGAMLDRAATPTAFDALKKAVEAGRASVIGAGDRHGSRTMPMRMRCA